MHGRLDSPDMSPRLRDPQRTTKNRYAYPLRALGALRSRPTEENPGDLGPSRGPVRGPEGPVRARDYLKQKRGRLV